LKSAEVDWLAAQFFFSILRVVAAVSEDAMLLNVGFEDELLCLLDVFLEVVLVPKEKVRNFCKLVSGQFHSSDDAACLPDIPQLAIPGYVCVALHEKTEPNLSLANLEAVAVLLLLVENVFKAYSILLTQLVE
jgi:hypothetical protein